MTIDEKRLVRSRAAALLNAVRGASGGSGSLAEFKKEAAAAFESDMQPVCRAVSAALKSGDADALRGLRALLPHLLEEVNKAPALADLLAHQLGKSLLEGLKAKPEETL
jgi:hypothetical protein